MRHPAVHERQDTATQTGASADRSCLPAPPCLADMSQWASVALPMSVIVPGHTGPEWRLSTPQPGYCIRPLTRSDSKTGRKHTTATYAAGPGNPAQCPIAKDHTTHKTTDTDTDTDTPTREEANLPAQSSALCQVLGLPGKRLRPLLPASSQHGGCRRPGGGRRPAAVDLRRCISLSSCCRGSRGRWGGCGWGSPWGTSRGPAAHRGRLHACQDDGGVPPVL